MVLLQETFTPFTTRPCWAHTKQRTRTVNPGGFTAGHRQRVGPMTMRTLTCCGAAAAAALSVLAGEWEFTGTTSRSDWQRTGTNWSTVFVKLDTTNILMDCIRVIYCPTNGAIEDSCWMLKPMPPLKSPPTIPALITATNGSRCRLVFEADRWDFDSKNRGMITLRTLELMESGGPTNASAVRATALP
jgi:hypothetical protein